MIKKLVLLAALTLVFRVTGLLPFETRDVAQLNPVEALVISGKDGQLVLRGGDCTGIGETWQEALEDLRSGAKGILFLGTAEQVVLCEGTEAVLEDIAAGETVRPAAVVVRCTEQELDPKEAAAFLSNHDAGMTLQQVRGLLLKKEPMELPVLRKTEGGLRLDDTGKR